MSIHDLGYRIRMLACQQVWDAAKLSAWFTVYDTVNATRAWVQVTGASFGDLSGLAAAIIREVNHELEFPE